MQSQDLSPDANWPGEKWHLVTAHCVKTSTDNSGLLSALFSETDNYLISNHSPSKCLGWEVSTPQGKRLDPSLSWQGFRKYWTQLWVAETQEFGPWRSLKCLTSFPVMAPHDSLKFCLRCDSHYLTGALHVILMLILRYIFIINLQRLPCSSLNEDQASCLCHFSAGLIDHENSITCSFLSVAFATYNQNCPPFSEWSPYL